MKHSQKNDDDNEDLIDVKRPSKKSRADSSKLFSKEDNPETQEILEYALNDFRDFPSLNKYKNLKFLTLNNQNIQSIDVKIAIIIGCFKSPTMY